MLPRTSNTLAYQASIQITDPSSCSVTCLTVCIFFTDMNDFLSQSGWFSHPGLPHGKVALQHVIAKKAGLSYDAFVAMEEAVYLFDYRHGEKVVYVCNH